jgi:hypothetical protein
LPLSSQAKASILSPLPNTLISGWAKCAAIFRNELSVTAATRRILR